jgi:uncharacterized protein (DUF1697 family)
MAEQQAAAASTTRFAVFLRAINTGRRRIKMADLAAAYRDAGYEDVATFLASGNVVLSSPDRPGPAALSKIVSDAFGFESEAFVRTGAELASVVERNPWSEPGALVEVSFIEHIPEPRTAKALESVVKPPAGLVVSGREVFHLREGKGIDPAHKETTTAKMLGQVTTRRGLRTVREMHLRFFSD